MSWSFVEPESHLLLTMSVVVFLATLAFVIPTIVAVRRGTSTDAIAWADQLPRDVGATWTMDRVLRAVDASCAAGGVVFPGALRIVIGSTVRLDLASPTAAPPAPWTATPDSRSWWAPMAALQAVPLTAPAPSTFGAVVAVGTDAGETVLVDLRQVRGIVALGGDRAAREALLRRIVDQVRCGPWAVGTTLLSVGTGPGPGMPVTVREAVEAVAADATPGLLVVSRVPAGEDGRELARLLERRGGRWACVATAPHPLARWTLDVRRDGRHVSDALGTVQWSSIGVTTQPTADVQTVSDATAQA